MLVPFREFIYPVITYYSDSNLVLGLIRAEFLNILS
jgi:hypothetical protein